MSNCIFCSIIEGKVESNKVYENEHTYCFLDANPLSEGHTLIIPKQHSEQLEGLDDKGEAVFKTATKIAGEIAKTVGTTDYNIGLNNGGEAGQQVEHVHLHVVPRFEDDGGKPIHAISPSTPNQDDDEMSELAKELSNNIDN